MAARDASAPRPGATRTPETADAWVGDYRLLDKVGEGGMGVVHLAEASDGRQVALKVLRPHVVGDEEARLRLEREVASLERVRSPRVAEVLDADPWGEVPYVATRYVPGPSLHEHLRSEGPILGESLVHFAHALAEALEAVHAVGVLHRDVKPTNVLLEGRSPVLIDFGLARLAEDSRITHTGWLLGTPGYLAPEILHGDDPTPAADVHAWAATVAFASTGAPPYGRGPAMAVMDRVRRGEHDLREVDPLMRRLVEECLAPDPLDRPPLPEVLERLESWLEGHPSSEEDRGPATRMMPLVPVAPPRDVGPLQRWLLGIGAAAASALAILAAPVLALLVLTALVLVLRTASWASSATRERQQIRGRARWYDLPLTVAASPWYAGVATWGTLVLLTWTGLLVFLLAVGLLLVGVTGTPLLVGLALMTTLALWWLPGSMRVRLPSRRLARFLTRRPGRGWAGVLVLALLAAVLAWSLASEGTRWDPAPGAPWRDGTLLGELAR
ncbi:MAG: serine/threonine-protein kinase [Nocardioides sp.]|nr:serine/threonine-protein kinase [Nocardioides sp.]